jgi:hypothetical protein
MAQLALVLPLSARGEWLLVLRIKGEMLRRVDGVGLGDDAERHELGRVLTMRERQLQIAPLLAPPQVAWAGGFACPAVDKMRTAPGLPREFSTCPLPQSSGAAPLSHSAACCQHVVDLGSLLF